MEINVAVGEPPLGEIYEAQENAHACIAADEYSQAVDFLTKALSLIPVSSDWFSEATSPRGSCDPIHALSTTLTLERADCHLRLRQFEEAIDAADNVLSTARRNIKAKRVKCEALFGLKQEKAAMKIWTNVLLETSNSPEFEVLRTRYPIAAVHVLHAVKMAEPREERNQVEATVQSHTTQHPSCVGTTPTRVDSGCSVSPASRVDDTASRSPFMSVGAAMLGHREPIPTNEPAVRQAKPLPTRKSMSDDEDDLESFYDPVFTDLQGDHAAVPTPAPDRLTAVAVAAKSPPSSEVRQVSARLDMPLKNAVSQASVRLDMPLETAVGQAPVRFDMQLETVAESPTSRGLSSPTDRDSFGSESMVLVGKPSDGSESMVFVGAPETPQPNGFYAAPNAAERPPPAPVKRRADKAELAQKLEFAKECLAQKDFVALLQYIDEVMEIEPIPSFLYERALCIEAIPVFSVADKIAALTEYVAQNPLTDEWIPHALYMMSAHYLELHEFSDAARMRFLADECEFLRERHGTFPPINSAGTFPKKAEVENAFTPPWLVLSFDEQRKSIESGSLACRTCPQNSPPVPLTKYVEHRTTQCPARATHDQETKQSSKKMSGK